MRGVVVGWIAAVVIVPIAVLVAIIVIVVVLKKSKLVAYFQSFLEVTLHCTRFCCIDRYPVYSRDDVFVQSATRHPRKPRHNLHSDHKITTTSPTNPSIRIPTLPHLPLQLATNPRLTIAIL